MNLRTILIVDDEAEIRAVLRRGLEAEGWDVREAANRQELFAALGSGNIDLVTLDLMLGQENGLEIARELRAQRNVPVVMISGRAEPFDRVRGLESGADDYVVKPFHIREVVMRIRMVLDRYQGHPTTGAILHFDHTEVDMRQGTIIHAGVDPVELTGIELQLLQLFVSQPGRVLSRDDISRALHGREWSPFDRTIDGHVARLRRKIEPPGEAPIMIRSVRGVGYVFVGDVRPETQPA